MELLNVLTIILLIISTFLLAGNSYLFIEHLVKKDEETWTWLVGTLINLVFVIYFAWMLNVIAKF